MLSIYSIYFLVEIAIFLGNSTCFSFLTQFPKDNQQELIIYETNFPLFV